MQSLLKTAFEKHSLKLLLAKKPTSTTERLTTNLSNYLGFTLPATPKAIETFSCSVRWAHTDIRVPDFSEYRRPSNRCPNVKSKETVDERRLFTYFLSAALGAGTMYSAKAIMTHYVLSMAASGDVLALAKIEIKLSEIPEGSNITFKWRGKFFYINLTHTPKQTNKITLVQKVTLHTYRKHDIVRYNCA